MSETTEISRTPIDLSPVESSQLHSIGHDPETNTLAICFKAKGGAAGSTYHYANFTAEDFAAFKSAESLGSHFGKHIKPHDVKHPYVKIEKDTAKS